MLETACPSGRHFQNRTQGVFDATINLLVGRRGFFRWWRDESSGNKVRKTFANCV